MTLSMAIMHFLMNSDMTIMFFFFIESITNINVHVQMSLLENVVTMQQFLSATCQNSETKEFSIAMIYC